LIRARVIRIPRETRIAGIYTGRGLLQAICADFEFRVQEDVVVLIAGIAVVIGGGDGTGSGRGTGSVEIAAGVVDVVVFDGRVAVDAVDPTAEASSTR
jgi:hypothetical protein